MKIVYTFLALSICTLSFGQNLVPNGDFETFDPCPIMQGLIEYAQPWINPATTTPDYFNACAQGTNGGVPLNNRGYQFALSGEGYAGIIAISQVGTFSNLREYIGVQLIEPLESGVTYELQFYVNLGNTSNLAIPSIGAHFSDSSSLPLNGQLLDVIPQIVNSSGTLMDTLDWMPISGFYTAIGGEQFLSIGNFENDDNSGIEEVGGMHDWAFYYIDDVSLSNVVTSTKESSFFSTSIYPNPFNSNFHIKSSDNQQYHFRMYDIIGRTILEKDFQNSITVNTIALKNGTYFYELKNSEGISKNGKIIKH